MTSTSTSTSEVTTTATGSGAVAALQGGRAQDVENGVRRVLQRMILPADRDMDVLPLYIDREQAILDSGDRGKDSATVVVAQTEHLEPESVLDRHRLRVRGGKRVSFGTYFNGFPASYWRMWTVVTSVRLTVRVTGPEATLVVYRSMADGRSQRVDAAMTEDEGTSEFTFELPLKPFVDGGWYWYDVVAGDEDVVAESGEWTAEVPADRGTHGTTTIGITTMNRPDFCAKLIGQIADTAELRPYLDEVLVVDQGTQKVSESPLFPGAQESLGDTLRVIEQANLGGSGGYARGQLATGRRGTATYFLCMDDDVVCDPEGIICAVSFADRARRSTIVGGSMFSL